MRKKFMIKMASIGAVVLLAAGMAACGKKTEAVSERHSESVQKRQRDLSILPVVRSETKGGRG